MCVYVYLYVVSSPTRPLLPGERVAPELGKERPPVHPNAVIRTPVQLVEGDEE